MLRKLVMAGVVVGAFASVPAFFQANPHVMERVLGDGDAGKPADATPKLALARTQGVQPRSEALSGRRVRLVADARGQYSAEFRLNGRIVPAMIDTGASVVAINRSTARRIGLTLNPGDFKAEVETANGRTKAAMALIDRLEIGRIDLRDVQAVVLEDHALAGTLIGMTFLSQLRRFGVENGALVLEQ